MSDLEAFRTEVRAWLEANCPPSMRGDTGAVDDDDNSIWGGR
jgi:acyl-CoA dehydrogenase